MKFRSSLLRHLGLPTDLEPSPPPTTPTPMTGTVAKEQSQQSLESQEFVRGGQAMTKERSKKGNDPAEGASPPPLASTSRLLPDPSTGLAPLFLTETISDDEGRSGVNSREESNILCVLRLRRSSLRMLQACAQHSPDIRQCCDAPLAAEPAVERQVWLDYATLCSAALDLLPRAEAPKGGATVVPQFCPLSSFPVAQAVLCCCYNEHSTG